ncbi:cyclic GMP-AMP synthase DncV-like nucleotidyltransferase [Bacillus altitudinis]|uniref:nucleotide-binding domain-containing protein n=1 Tax=Bacillus altitudinis TaxID=293387 RepID=UPI0037C75A11
MYDLSGKFNTFYNNHVVLKRKQKSDLHEKKDLNIERLKEGLQAYNEENGTDYKLAEEPVVQGSVTMHTVTQNDTNDYDIDVAVVFEKDGIPEGTIAAKRVVEQALLKKCTGFKEPPKAHTNCVRIVYNDGYHIDFAVYRRFKQYENDDEYTYEHCGSEWRERDPRKITKWFVEQNRDEHNFKLREVVRLLKMFCKSRDFWTMPGGLIQSVLADEKCQSEYSRIDERFYYTIKDIRDRLGICQGVFNPTDPTKSLTYTQKDMTRVNNLYTRLESYIKKLDVLFENKCTKEDAISAWCEFFNHTYWEEQKEELRKSSELNKAFSEVAATIPYQVFNETEEFIEHLFAVDIKYELKLDCEIVREEQKIGVLENYLIEGKRLEPGLSLCFKAVTNVPEPYQVYWKTKNRGSVAVNRNEIRGQIFEGYYPDKLFHIEGTKFSGDHYVECYVVKNNICVARGRINVPIA